MITKIESVLEIDHDRGVVYVHLAHEKDIKKHKIITAVRIQGLGKIPELKDQMIDIKLLSNEYD